MKSMGLIFGHDKSEVLMKDLNEIVGRFASELSEIYNTPDNDYGAFDSSFCGKIEALIESTYLSHNLKRLREYEFGEYFRCRNEDVRINNVTEKNGTFRVVAEAKKYVMENKKPVLTKEKKSFYYELKDNGDFRLIDIQKHES